MRLTAGWVTFNSAAAAVKLPVRAAASKTNSALLEDSIRRSSAMTSDYAAGDNLAIARQSHLCFDHKRAQFDRPTSKKSARRDRSPSDCAATSGSTGFPGYKTRSCHCKMPLSAKRGDEDARPRVPRRTSTNGRSIGGQSGRERRDQIREQELRRGSCARQCLAECCAARVRLAARAI